MELFSVRAQTKLKCYNFRPNDYDMEYLRYFSDIAICVCVCVHTNTTFLDQFGYSFSFCKVRYPYSIHVYYIVVHSMTNSFSILCIDFSLWVRSKDTRSMNFCKTLLFSPSHLYNKYSQDNLSLLDRVYLCLIRIWPHGKSSHAWRMKWAEEEHPV